MSAQAIGNHLGMLFAALYVSEGWFDSWSQWHDAKQPHMRKMSMYGRARAVVLYDRVLNGEMRA